MKSGIGWSSWGRKGVVKAHLEAERGGFIMLRNVTSLEIKGNSF